MLYIILATIFYTGAILAATVANRAINTNLVAAIVNVISAILPVIIAWQFINKKIITDLKLGVLMAIVAGVLIAFFSLAFNKSLAVNKVAIVSPIVYGGSIFLLAIFSAILFKEKISGIQGIGLLLIGAGLLTVVYARATGH